MNILIDICGTLFRSNTTFDFLDFWFKKESWYQKMKRLRRYKVVGFANSIFFRLFHVDIMRNYAISHLKGYSKTDLQKMSTRFYVDYLSTVINNDVVGIIEEKRKNGYELIAVSATLDCIADEICQKLNIPKHFSSTLDFNRDGKCTGRLKKDWLACKLVNLQEEGLNPPYDFVITDNFSDIDIIKNSNFSYLIQYAKCRKKWQDVLLLYRVKYKIINK